MADESYVESAGWLAEQIGRGWWDGGNAGHKREGQDVMSYVLALVMPAGLCQ